MKCYAYACLIVILLKSLAVITYVVVGFVEVKLGYLWLKWNTVKYPRKIADISNRIIQFSNIYLWNYFCYAWQYCDWYLKQSMWAHSHVSASD